MKNTAFVSEIEEQFKGERFGPARNAEAQKDSHVN